MPVINTCWESAAAGWECLTRGINTPLAKQVARMCTATQPNMNLAEPSGPGLSSESPWFDSRNRTDDGFSAIQGKDICSETSLPACHYHHRTRHWRKTHPVLPDSIRCGGRDSEACLRVLLSSTRCTTQAARLQQGAQQATRAAPWKQRLPRLPPPRRVGTSDACCRSGRSLL